MTKQERLDNKALRAVTDSDWFTWGAKRTEDDLPRILADTEQDIHHEHLASISQHDWYQSCYQTNSAVLLENVTYCVVCLEQGQIDEISFTNLHDLMVWAGY